MPPSSPHKLEAYPPFYRPMSSANATPHRSAPLEREFVDKTWLPCPHIVSNAARSSELPTDDWSAPLASALEEVEKLHVFYTSAMSRHLDSVGSM